MTDRELLELAAKACGYDTSIHWNAERLTLTPPVIGLCIKGVSTCWNPLDDDGDALQLAVKLGLQVYTPDDGDDIAVVRNYSGLYVQEMGEDHNKITRRAIVRAAAELQRQKETK